MNETNKTVDDRIREELDRDLRNAKMLGDSMDMLFKAMFKPTTDNQQDAGTPEGGDE